VFCVGVSRKTRIMDVVYNASNNELVRTKTLVKNAIVVIDAVPFRNWYEAHYALPLSRKKGAKLVSSIAQAYVAYFGTLEAVKSYIWDTENTGFNIAEGSCWVGTLTKLLGLSIYVVYAFLTFGISI